MMFLWKSTINVWKGRADQLCWDNTHLRDLFSFLLFFFEYSNIDMLLSIQFHRWYCWSEWSCCFSPIRFVLFFSFFILLLFLSIVSFLHFFFAMLFFKLMNQFLHFFKPPTPHVNSTRLDPTHSPTTLKNWRAEVIENTDTPKTYSIFFLGDMIESPFEQEGIKGKRIKPTACWWENTFSFAQEYPTTTNTLQV